MSLSDRKAIVCTNHALNSVQLIVNDHNGYSGGVMRRGMLTNIGGQSEYSIVFPGSPLIG